MNAHNMNEPDRMRVNEKSSLAYYDPTENMDNNLMQNMKNNGLYVVPIQVEDDLRSAEDKDHVYLKQNLKKQTQSVRNREKYYYDPTVDSYMHYVDRDSHMQEVLSRNSPKPQTMSIQQWFKQEKKKEDLNRMITAPTDRQLSYYDISIIVGWIKG